eukprot:7000890-Alexandrium_andersonii.AAC.1
MHLCSCSPPCGLARSPSAWSVSSVGIAARAFTRKPWQPALHHAFRALRVPRFSGAHSPRRRAH